MNSTGRYPTHDASKRIEQSNAHKEELAKLTTPDGDYHHGVHCGLLAASRMFQKQADILHVADADDVESPELEREAAKHQERINESLVSYPELSADTFPEH